MKPELIKIPFLARQELTLPAGSEIIGLLVDNDILYLNALIAADTTRADGAELWLEPDLLTGTLKSVPAKAKEKYEVSTLLEAEQGHVVTCKDPQTRAEVTRDLHEEFIRELTRCDADPNTLPLGRVETKDPAAFWRVYLTKLTK
jgi:hypothetical protein